MCEEGVVAWRNVPKASANISKHPLPRNPKLKINTELGITVCAPDNLPDPPSPPPTPPPSPNLKPPPTPHWIGKNTTTDRRGSTESSASSMTVPWRESVASIVSVESSDPPSPPESPSRERTPTSSHYPKCYTSEMLSAVVSGSEPLDIPPIPNVPPPERPAAPPLPPKNSKKRILSRSSLAQPRHAILEATQKYIDQSKNDGKETIYLVLKKQLISEFGDEEFNRFKSRVQELLRGDFQELVRSRSFGASAPDLAFTPGITPSATPRTTPRTLPDTASANAPDISHAATDPIKPSALFTVPSNHSPPSELCMDPVSSSDVGNTPVVLINDINHLFDHTSSGNICFSSTPSTCDSSDLSESDSDSDTEEHEELDKFTSPSARVMSRRAIERRSVTIETMNLMAQANKLATRVLDDIRKHSLQELEDRLRPELVKRFDESVYLKNREQVLELLTRVRDGNHLLSTSILPQVSPTADPELEAALASKFEHESISHCRSSMVLTASMARTKRRQTLARQNAKNFSRISSFMVQKTTRYITYLNEGAITFNVKIKKSFLSKRRQLRLTPQAIFILNVGRLQSLGVERVKTTWGYEQLLSMDLIDDRRLSLMLESKDGSNSNKVVLQSRMVPQILAELKRRRARAHTRMSFDSQCKVQEFTVIRQNQPVYSHPDVKRGKVVGVKKRGETVRVGQRRGAWIQLEAGTEVRVLTQQQEKNKQRAMSDKNACFWMQAEMVEESGKTQHLLAKDSRHSLIRQASKRSSLLKREELLKKLLGENETERVSVQLHSLLYSKTSTEGTVRRDFLANFRTYGHERNWPKPLPRKIQIFVENMTDLIIKVHGDSLRKLQDSSAREDDVLRLQHLVSLKVEESVYFGLQHEIRAAINADPRYSVVEVERDLGKRIKHYSKQPQSTFGIPQEAQSRSGWQSAITELKLIDHTGLPSLKLQQLLTCVKEIMAISEAEHSASDMGADDFLPVFTYVIAHGELQSPWSTCRLMWDATPRRVLTGEREYYLTCFESALHSLLEMDAKREPRTSAKSPP